MKNLFFTLLFFSLFNNTYAQDKKFSLQFNSGYYYSPGTKYIDMRKEYLKPQFLKNYTIAATSFIENLTSISLQANYQFHPNLSFIMLFEYGTSSYTGEFIDLLFWPASKVNLTCNSTVFNNYIGLRYNGDINEKLSLIYEFKTGIFSTSIFVDQKSIYTDGTVSEYKDLVVGSINKFSVNQSVGLQYKLTEMVYLNTNLNYTYIFGGGTSKFLQSAPTEIIEPGHLFGLNVGVGIKL